MARYRINELEEIANNEAKWTVINAVKGEVNALIGVWEKNGYPESYGECERAVGQIIRASSTYTSLQGTSLQYNGRVRAIEHFLKDVGRILRTRQLQAERQKTLTFKGRKSIEEGIYHSPYDIGDFVGFSKQNRVLVCIECDFVRAEPDMGQDDDEYYCHRSSSVPCRRVLCLSSFHLVFTGILATLFSIPI